MTSMASTSRVLLGRAQHSSASSSLSFSRRHFASSSRAQESRRLVISFANRTATFTLPSVSSILEPIFAAPVSQHQPALAGIPTGIVEESNEESSDVLEWDGVLNAVPKSKVSHSRKAMRAANKGLKDRVDFVHCASCGKPKLAHHICATCFSFVSRTQKASKKQAMENAKAELAKNPDVTIVNSRPGESN